MTEEQKLYHYQGYENILEEVKDIKEQKKSISLFLNSALRSSNLAFFMGSGCSVDVVPLMGNTMKKILEEDSGKIKSLAKKYAGEDDIFGFSDIEGFLNWLQAGISFSEKNRPDEVQDLKEISALIKSALCETIPVHSDERYLTSEVARTYTEFYKIVFKNKTEMSNKVSIFTTNYDLFNEYALENNNIFYTTGFSLGLKSPFDINQFKYRLVDDTERYKDRWQPVNREANIFKLHGSINWKQSSEGGLFQDNQNREDIDDIIIYPTTMKHEETALSPYSELFREFTNNLQKKNTTLFVLGYGFPDEHINNIIEQNLKNSDFTLVVFGNIKEYNMSEFHKKQKGKKNVHVIGGTLEKGMGHYFNIIVEEYLSSIVSQETGGEHE